ncbi:hypothetical protein P3X46_029788 [Hevea brasiliensis]|uniref:Uncharacterized protein n=1 Tax=Hevea brasiliensis TaxID=3981 RepID=A0ABQ9KTB8_HEVBR|nr:acyltransferase GLAUCE [Hevea brasiliensis]KAJ9147653.1 hypothetical protein P3X46_029788 [Hevea brasiliensis]
MAMPYFTNNGVPKSQIEAIQTVPPFQVTDPREFRLISVAETIGSGIFTGCLNIVLYYNKAMEKDSGWLVAGWIKESLGRALREQPMLSGRLGRGENGRGELEIVSNDSGVRLVEAKISVTLREFLDLKEKEKAEAELVFWKYIDEQNPQFSPLLFVQVTNFQCGGYSIGISCSLLLADLLIMDNFLLKWANIQKDMLSKNDEVKLPLFYLPNLKTASLAANRTFSPASIERCGQTMIFRITGENVDLKNESSKKLALLCMEEAEQKLGNKIISSEFSFLMKESPTVMQVENFKKIERVNSHLMSDQVMITSSSLKDYLEINEIAFTEGNKPAQVSYWAGAVNDGLAVAIPSSNEGVSELNFIITFPIEKGI